MPRECAPLLRGNTDPQEDSIGTDCPILSLHPAIACRHVRKAPLLSKRSTQPKRRDANGTIARLSPEVTGRDSILIRSGPVGLRSDARKRAALR